MRSLIPELPCCRRLPTTSARTCACCQAVGRHIGPRESRDLGAAVDADDGGGAGTGGKHGEDAGAAANVEHARAAQQAGVQLEGVAVRLGAHLQGAGGFQGWQARV